MPGKGPTRALGGVIRRQRELNHVSMRRFASMAGISNPYLSQIERGLRDPSARVLDAIASSLQMSADDLYTAAGIAREDVDADSTARQALEADANLTPRQRRALLEVYDSFVLVNKGHTDKQSDK